jgi:hypothetical protein
MSFLVYTVLDNVKDTNYGLELLNLDFFTSFLIRISEIVSVINPVINLVKETSKKHTHGVVKNP